MTKLILTIAVLSVTILSSIQTSASERTMTLPNSKNTLLDFDYNKLSDKEKKATDLMFARVFIDVIKDTPKSKSASVTPAKCDEPDEIRFFMPDKLQSQENIKFICSNKVIVRAKAMSAAGNELEGNQSKSLRKTNLQETINKEQDYFEFTSNKNSGIVKLDATTTSGFKETVYSSYKFTNNPTCAGWLMSDPVVSIPDVDQVKKAFAECDDPEIVNYYTERTLKSAQEMELSLQKAELEYQKKLNELGLKEDPFKNGFNPKNNLKMVKV
jgi:hypothetical protein